MDQSAVSALPTGRQIIRSSQVTKLHDPTRSRGTSGFTEKTDILKNC